MWSFGLGLEWKREKGLMGGEIFDAVRTILGAGSDAAGSLPWLCDLKTLEKTRVYR
jgi:hypothetical protein